MKNQQGEVIGFEKLSYNFPTNTNLKFFLETAIASALTLIWFVPNH